MLNSELRGLFYLLGALQVAGLPLFLTARRRPAFITNALQPFLVLIVTVPGIVQSAGSGNLSAWAIGAAFLALEVFVLTTSVAGIWRKSLSPLSFWSSWIGNLPPLVSLGYFAFYFHIF